MKAVLAVDMDMPKRCGECKFRSPELNPCEELVWLCKLKDDFIDRRTRPDWCPLRSTPKRNEYRGDTKDEDMDKYDLGYADGWNDCLEEITAYNNLWRVVGEEDEE